VLRSDEDNKKSSQFVSYFIFSAFCKMEVKRKFYLFY
jgi:hypothetical protein